MANYEFIYVECRMAGLLLSFQGVLLAICHYDSYNYMEVIWAMVKYLRRKTLNENMD